MTGLDWIAAAAALAFVAFVVFAIQQGLQVTPSTDHDKPPNSAA